MGRGDVNGHRLRARVLALLTPRAATRMRVFLLTLAVFDDLTALGVIASSTRATCRGTALVAAIALFFVLLALRYLPMGRTPASVVVAVALWVAMLKSGIDPLVSGLAVGLVTSAYPPERGDLERASAVARSFREQPTPELARSVQREVAASISANERMQYELHPWVSYVVLPLFALANAGVHITGGLLEGAIESPVFSGSWSGTWSASQSASARSWLASRPALHGPRPLISGPILFAAGTCAGIGFTVSLLISNLAFSGVTLEEAKLAVLGTLVLAPLMTRVVAWLVKRLPTTCGLARSGALRRTSRTSPTTSTPIATTFGGPRTRP